MNTDLSSLFISTCYNRGNKALVTTYLYGKRLSASEKDELLTCSRIAKQRLQVLQQRGAVCK